jgi:hypothetical protein
MCDFDGKIVAWLDQELPPDGAAAVEKHLEVCAECRERAAAYAAASAGFIAYRDAFSETQLRRGPNRWPRVVLAVGSVAAILALTIATHHSHTAAQLPKLTSPYQSASAVPGIIRVPGARGASRTKEVPHIIHVAGIRHASRAGSAITENNPQLPPSPELPVQITIPAEAVLPPGAEPAGTSFVVDFSIGPDGSTQIVRLRPQLAEFQRR